MRALRLLVRAAVPTAGGLLVLASVAGWGRPAGLPMGAVQQPDAARAVRQLTQRQAPGPATVVAGGDTRSVVLASAITGPVRPMSASASPVPVASSAVASSLAASSLAASAPAALTMTASAPAASGAAASTLAGSAPTASTQTMPADFARVMGYRPVVSEGRLLRADGSCSSPFGPTGYGFQDSCRAHDLGYDLLRYAERKGQPLGPWARRAVDDAFSRSLHARCGPAGSNVGCDAAATVYADAVRLNTWRQGFGVPVVEGPGRTLLGLGVGLVVAVLLAGQPWAPGRLRTAPAWPSALGRRPAAAGAPR